MKRWICPQCFTSIRDEVKAYKVKPKTKCRDHFTLDWVEIEFPLQSNQCSSRNKKLSVFEIKKIIRRINELV